MTGALGADVVNAVERVLLNDIRNRDNFFDARNFSGQVTFQGGNGVDTLYGGAGNDLLGGGSADDILNGGADDDFIDGGGNGVEAHPGDTVSGATIDEAFVFDAPWVNV